LFDGTAQGTAGDAPQRKNPVAGDVLKLVRWRGYAKKLVRTGATIKKRETYVFLTEEPRSWSQIFLGGVCGGGVFWGGGCLGGFFFGGGGGFGGGFLLVFGLGCFLGGVVLKNEAPCLSWEDSHSPVNTYDLGRRTAEGNST